MGRRLSFLIACRGQILTVFAIWTPTDQWRWPRPSGSTFSSPLLNTSPRFGRPTVDTAPPRSFRCSNLACARCSECSLFCVVPRRCRALSPPFGRKGIQHTPNLHLSLGKAWPGGNAEQVGCLKCLCTRGRPAELDQLVRFLRALCGPLFRTIVAVHACPAAWRSSGCVRALLRAWLRRATRLGPDRHGPSRLFRR